MNPNRLRPLDVREKRKRKREWIAAGLLAFLFIALGLFEFRLTKTSSTLPFVNSIFFFGLLNVNIVILIALVWLVFRNIGKLFLEQRNKVIGARLKTKLVLAFLGFSIVPTLVLFTISATYINSSFDKWFSIKIQNTLQAALEIRGTYYKNADQTAMHFAEHLGEGIRKRFMDTGVGPSARTNYLPWLKEYLRSQRELLALHAVEFYPEPLDERILAQAPHERAGMQGEPSEGYPRLSLDLLERVFAGEKFSIIHHAGNGDLIRCLVPITLPAASVDEAGAERPPVIGAIVVNTYLPVSLVSKVDEIASVFEDYKDINPLKYPMKTIYLVILIMITLVMILVALWVGLYMAKQLTVPVENLVNGARAVESGNLDITILGGGNDEIGLLVETFNRMTQALRETSQDLEKRRLQLEAVLANVGTGVIVVERSGEVRTFNQALAQIFQVAPPSVMGADYRYAFGVEVKPLVELISSAFESSSKIGDSPQMVQWSAHFAEHSRTLAAVATPLRETADSKPWGVVAVVEDMTHLIKGQREMAWREVARRIAHEIKNPLTPIKLSAQRMQRRLSDTTGRDGELIRECTETIIRHTDELKEMVNEFSNFARFPEINPAPNNLNLVVREAVSLYRQAHPGIEIRFEEEPSLPLFEFDRDQLKRVILNLMNNAVASPSKQIQVRTIFHSSLQIAVLEVQDNGPGMTEEVRDRIFEPYFSTKSEGTGLGLAIAKRIVNDHNGFIRVHSTPGEGAQFIVELPTVSRGGALSTRP